MEMPRVAAAVAMALSLIIVNLAGQCSGQLQFGFYNGKCRDGNGFQRNVEDIVKQKVKAKFSTDTTIVAALLRMQFHDCFVNVSLSTLICFSTFCSIHAESNAISGDERDVMHLYYWMCQTERKLLLQI